MSPTHFLLFASDGALEMLGALACVLLSLLAMLGERRRVRRRAIDAVGWVPWRGLSLLFLCAGLALAMLAVGAG